MHLNTPWRLLAIAAAATIMLASCGGGDSSHTSSPATPADPSAPTSPTRPVTPGGDVTDTTTTDTGSDTDTTDTDTGSDTSSDTGSDTSSDTSSDTGSDTSTSDTSTTDACADPDSTDTACVPTDASVTPKLIPIGRGITAPDIVDDDGAADVTITLAPKKARNGVKVAIDGGAQVIDLAKGTVGSPLEMNFEGGEKKIMVKVPVDNANQGKTLTLTLTDPSGKNIPFTNPPNGKLTVCGSIDPTSTAPSSDQFAVRECAPLKVEPATTSVTEGSNVQLTFTLTPKVTRNFMEIDLWDINNLGVTVNNSINGQPLVHCTNGECVLDLDIPPGSSGKPNPRFRLGFWDASGAEYGSFTLTVTP